MQLAGATLKLFEPDGEGREPVDLGVLAVRCRRRSGHADGAGVMAFVATILDDGRGDGAATIGAGPEATVTVVTATTRWRRAAATPDISFRITW